MSRIKAYQIALGQAKTTYSPDDLAWEVVNWTRTPQGSLRSVRGPIPYEPDRGQGYPAYGRIHGLFADVANDQLYIRAGTKLYRYAGWNRNLEELHDGLTDDANAAFPDQWAMINGLVIWCNGVDRTLAISPDSGVVPLGFSASELPAAPSAECPAHLDAEDSTRTTLYPNSTGYSFPGRMGTVGDEISQVEGKLLAGSWYYYAQFEDQFGNLSALSPPSNAASVYAQSSVVDGTNLIYEEVDDLLRHMLVRSGGDAPEHAVATRLYRTSDTRNVSTDVQFLDRFGGTAQWLYPDPKSDSELGFEAKAYAPYPLHKLVCAHQGRLVVANFTGDPGMVRVSDIGFPGSLPSALWVVPEEGAAITGIRSHMGSVLLWTHKATYTLDVSPEGVVSRPLLPGVGCVAPSSIQTLQDGSIVWLAADGIYRIKGSGSVGMVSQDNMEVFARKINMSQARLATSVVSPDGEYILALPASGTRLHTYWLSLRMRGDEPRWTEYHLSMDASAFTATQDYVLFAAVPQFPAGVADENLFVFDHEVDTYTPPGRTSRYLSGWLRADDLGLRPLRVRSVYVRYEERWNGPITVRFYRNGSWQQVGEDLEMRMISDRSRADREQASQAVIGTETVQRASVNWRWVPCPRELDTCTTFAVELSADWPADIIIDAIAFDVERVDGGQVNGRVERSGYED